MANDYQSLVDEAKQLVKQLKDEKNSKQSTLKAKYLGKKGLFKELSQKIRLVPKEKKKEFGQTLNQVKEELQTEISKLNKKNLNLQAEIDLTIPGKKPKVGHVHPISQAIEEITQIFERIGFTRVRYPEVDWDHYVFEALNMPKKSSSS